MGECPTCGKISRLIHQDLHFIFPVNSGSKVSASSRPTSETYLPIWRELLLKNPYYFTESRLYEALGIENKSGNIAAVAEARYILEKLSFTSVEDGYKSVVVWLPEKMNAEAANRLLKIVEEPPAKTVFIFITHSPRKSVADHFIKMPEFQGAPVPQRRKWAMSSAGNSLSAGMRRTCSPMFQAAVSVWLCMRRKGLPSTTFIWTCSPIFCAVPGKESSFRT